MHDGLGSNPNVMLIYHFDFLSYIQVYTSMYHVCLSIYCYTSENTRFISVHTSMYLVYVDTYHSGILSST